MAISKTELENALVRLNVKVKDVERERDAYAHAFNLYLNNTVRWFFECPAKNEHGDSAGKHECGVGIVRAFPVKDSALAAAMGMTNTEDITVILWRTTWEGVGQYVTVWSEREFRRLPQTELADEQFVEMRDLIEKQVIPQLDMAIQQYRSFYGFDAESPDA